jgi:tetratricopeptide (TPR) repeat protein
VRCRLSCIVALFVAVAWLAPAAAGEAGERLDGLMAELRATADPEHARGLQERIWGIWLDAGDAEINRLMAEGVGALRSGAWDAAVARFTTIIERRPEFAEGWNKRATVYYVMGEYERSAVDIAETLAREPRHFGALAGLGLVNMALERWRAAKRAFEHALAINPHLADVRENLKLVERQLGGAPI